MQKKRRRISILLEVAVLFLIGVLTTGILTYLSERNLSDASVKAQTEQRASEIANEVKQSITEYPAYQWLLRYWYGHSDTLEIEYEVTFSSGTDTEAKCRELTTRYPGIQPRYLNGSQIEALPEQDQKLYAEIAYSWLITRINQIKRTYSIDYLFCVASKEPYDTQFFLFSGAEENAVRGTGYEEIYPLGKTVTVSGDQQDAMQNAYRASSHLADAGDYVDYYSYLDSFDDYAVFIGITYNLSGLNASIGRQTRIGTVHAMLHQGFLSVLCLVMIFFFVLRPLRSVQRNIRLYRETKDSETVKRNLAEIRPRNEIGQLSGDVADLTTEIDDYLCRIQASAAEKERITSELSLATRIQTAMLPNTFPAFPERPEFNIYALMDPAREVGGDFYDFFLTDDDHLCMVMADVSGKGIPAALFMMASRILLANNAKMGKSPAEILRDTNRFICANNPEEMFVTVWLGILEISTGTLTAANAGHEYPAVRSPGGTFELYRDPHGFVLGGMDGMQYRNYKLRMEPGTKLFVYTDGVPEASDDTNQMFGTERMLAALNEEAEASPPGILKIIRRAVDDFVKDAEQFDDLTMLCFEYIGQEPRGEKRL